MTDYQYTRELLPSGEWDINHPDRATTLADDVETALPGKTLYVRCRNGFATVIFENPLTAPEETTLDTTVANHKANT